MLKEIGSVFSFLTIFPSSNATLENIAKYMYIFPIVGIAIGLLVGSFGFGLSFFLDPLLVSLLVVASIAIVTGIHHADGSADFADGLMVKGSKDRKPKEPTKSPIAIPTIGKRYMYFAIFSKFAFDDGKIVRKENTEPISLSMNPPSNQ